MPSKTRPPRVGFVGLGTMGSAMASCLVRDGYDVTVFNRTPGRADHLAREGAVVAADLAEVISNCDVVGSCLRDGPAVRAIYNGPEGLLRDARPGQIFFEHGTFAPQVAREVAGVARTSGAAFLDIPVTGGPQRATSGQLAAMAGGPAEALEAIGSVLASYTTSVTHLGPVGCGLELKLVNQLLVSIHLAAAGEAVKLIDALGLDQSISRHVLSRGWAQSTMLDRTFEQLALGSLYGTGATINGLIEVQRLVARALIDARSPRSLFESAHQAFTEASNQGYGEADPAVLGTAHPPKTPEHVNGEQQT